MEKRKIIRSLISTGSYASFMENLSALSQNHASSYVCISNVHMVVEAYLDTAFCKVVNQADIATPDGMPLAKAMKLLYGIEQERVAGMDLFPDLIELSAQKGFSIFLYGSTPDVLEAIVQKTKSAFPSLELYTYSPPFRTLSEEEEAEVVHMINRHNPDFVFVSLGCPKQEKWMAKHCGKIDSCMIGLGGAFEVYAEKKERAPKWMQQYAVEWLYRLLQDPKRLWKRYLVTNTLFIVLLAMQIVRVRLLGQKD